MELFVFKVEAMDADKSGVRRILIWTFIKL